MKRTYSVSTHFVSEVIRAAKRLGCDAPPIDTCNPNRTAAGERIPLTDFCQLLDAYVVSTGDSHIGLKLGQSLQPACFNVLGHLVMASGTVGEAMAVVPTFHALVIDGADCEYSVSDDLLHFRWTPLLPQGTTPKPLIDLVLSATRNFGIWATGIEDPFFQVLFQYPKPECTAIYENIFGHSGIFNSPFNGFSIPLSWKDRTIRSASENLKPVIYHHAHQLLKTLQNDTSEGFISSLVDHIIRLLPEGHISIDILAKHLHVSPRTLQRHLHHHSTSFSKLLQQVRYEQANYLLKHTDLSLHEIALRLGYKEQSSFSSAYKLWTGCTPNSVRNHQVAKLA